MTVFNDKAPKFYKLLQFETVYYIVKGLIKPTTFRSTRIKHPFCIQLEEASRIENEFNCDSVELSFAGAKETAS